MEKTLVSTSWQKRFLDHLAAHPSLKKARVQKIFSLSQLNCSGARYKYSVQELKKTQPELCLPEKSGREGSFSLARCLGRAARIGEKGLIGEEKDMGIRGRAMVRVGVGVVLVMS